MQTFYDFLNQIRPLVNSSGLEKSAGIPRNTLDKHYRHADGKEYGQPCHPKHFSTIVRALCAVFGTIEIGGWRITCDPDGPAIFASQPIPDREIEIIEADGTFEYLQPERRHVYDDFDFSQYFGG